jgi:hypothetical protein
MYYSRVGRHNLELSDLRGIFIPKEKLEATSLRLIPTIEMDFAYRSHSQVNMTLGIHAFSAGLRLTCSSRSIRQTSPAFH